MSGSGHGIVRCADMHTHFGRRAVMSADIIP